MIEAYNTNNAHHIKLLYAGGTFGCHGKPLNPLAAEIFLPILLKAAVINTISSIPNTIIKDSSQLSPADFFAYYTSIREQYQTGCKKIILITGTDTLSYLAAFLYECFKDIDISICITASMHPLLFADKDIHTINYKSDAWYNFVLTSKTVNNYPNGVYVCVDKQVFTADSVQKLHSMSQHAFVGQRAEAYTPSLSSPDTHSDNMLTYGNTHSIEKLKLNLFKYDITPVYLYPAPIESLIETLTHIVKQAENNNTCACIVLMGFGTGNIPYSEALSKLLQQWHQHNHLIFSTSQCTFDGVSSDYAAGSWLYEHQVLSCGSMTKEYIFSKILWLSLISQDSQEIRKTWLAELS